MRAGVIRAVHRDRFRIVIDGEVAWAAQRAFDAMARTTAASEVINNQCLQALSPVMETARLNSRHARTASVTPQPYQ